MNLLKDALYSAASRIWPHNAAVILVYHSISNAAHFGAVKPENFEQQMRELRKRGFNVISLGSLVEMRKSENIPPKTVCITFDDGYEDNYLTAFPILRELNFPATIFVITDAIGTEWETRGERFKMLSEAQLKEMHVSGLITLEPHSASHPKLHHLSGDEVEREVRTSKNFLEALLGTTCRHFAYPKGGNNEVARTAVGRAGISYAYTTHEGLVRAGDDNLRLNRNGVNRTVSLPQFLGTATWGRLSRARVLGI